MRKKAFEKKHPFIGFIGAHFRAGMIFSALGFVLSLTSIILILNRSIRKTENKYYGKFKIILKKEAQKLYGWICVQQAIAGGCFLKSPSSLCFAMR
jgi:hypothetical protein